MFDFFKKKLSDGITSLKKVIGLISSEYNETEIKKILFDLNFSTSFIKYLIEKIKNSTEQNWKTTFENEITELFKVPSFSYDDIDIAILVGINGSGKTTSIIKLARQYKKNYKTLVVPADTFRAAAKDQLENLAKLYKVDCFSHSIESPATVIFKAAEYSNENHYQKIIIDTAGRIHQNDSLLRELKKIITVSYKQFQQKKIKTLLVLDGLQGKNLFDQTKIFKNTINIDGLIVTKLDSQTKPGILCSIAHEFKIPIIFLGVGQQETDLLPFDVNEFIKLFSL